MSIMPSYFDFDVWLSRHEEGYRAKGWDPHGREAMVVFETPWNELEIENFRLRLGRPPLRRAQTSELEAAKEFGGPLFESVFHGDLLSCFRASLEEARRDGLGLRLRLRLEETPELADLPWEYLYDKGLNRFFALSANTPVVRYLEIPERVPPLRVEGPLRILVMVSSPSDHAELEVEGEWRYLNEALGDLTRCGRVELHRLAEPTLPALQEELRKTEFHALHFIGHGEFRRSTEEGVLIFQDENGRGRPVSGENLAIVLHDHVSLRLAVLNACEGACASHADPFSGVAQTLVRQGLPAVVAMQSEITDEAALTLAHEFYRALADGYPIDACLAEARKSLSGLGNVEWGTAVLFMRAPDGRLFNRPAMRTAEMPIGTLALRTLMTAELVGGRQLFAKLGDAEAARLNVRHDRKLRDLMRRFSGREVEKGEGFVLLFDRAVDAVACAVAYHDALAALSDKVGEDLGARVGIHLGELFLHENSPGDVARGARPLEAAGLARTIAGRVMALARPRQTLLTRSVFDLARRGAAGVLADEEVRWLAHGTYVLEGLKDPVEICEVGLVTTAPLLPPSESEKTRRHLSPEEETMLGWRPGPGLEIPRRPHWGLERQIGAGGFGEVWLALHRKTKEQRVFKFCFDADRLDGLKREITLFRLLNEELGQRRDIVRILDWDFEEAPYFLEAEYNALGNLEEWTEKQGGPDRLPTATRLEIVIQVAEALAAAHSAGVLHKDVKPSNVLISTNDSGGFQAQLVDFGIGTVTQRERLEQAGISVLGMSESTGDEAGSSSQTGTRLYMAPEVLEGRRATHQADIYALGVMLYQLVVGDFKRALAPGWRREIADELLVEDISCFVDGQPEKRPVSALEVARRLRGLDERRARREAERREREAAAADRRALEGAQRRRRFYKALSAAIAGLLAVVSGLALWAFDARQGEARARQTAETVTEFMVELFEVADPFGTSDPGAARGEEVTALEILDRGTAKLERGFGEEPLVRAQLMDTLGNIYVSLGLYDKAEPLIERASMLRRQNLGGDHVDIARSLNSEGKLLQAQGDYDGAEPLLRGALEIRRRSFGIEHPDVADSLNDLAGLLYAQGNYDGAEPLYREALEMRRRLLGDEHPDLAISLSNLALLLWVKKDYDGAEQLLREALRMNRELLGNEHPNVASNLNNLAGLLWTQGDYEGAEPLLRETLRMNRKLLGNEHPNVANSLNNLAGLVWAQRDYESAEPLFRQALEMHRRLLGDEHPKVAISLSHLAAVLVARGAATEAEELVHEALAIFRQTFPTGHWRIATAESVLGACLTSFERYEEAESLLLEGYAVISAAKGEKAIYTRDTLERLVTLYEAWGKEEMAAEYRALWIAAGGST